MENDNANNAGAAYVYRRSPTGVWAIEAYVKAPNSGGGDRFGAALALSADGAALAVGAPFENSGGNGAFHPGDLDDYDDALGGSGAPNAGAAYVYQRSSTGVWAIEAYVKAPNSGTGDQFGFALALSADGAVLAVGAPEEDSTFPRTATIAFHPGEPDYADALADNFSASAGAAYVYRRSSTGVWAIEAYVKKPFRYAAGGDRLGTALALSADGATLAVGAPFEDSGLDGVQAPGRCQLPAVAPNLSSESAGAAYVYRRSSTGQWVTEAYVKAPNSQQEDIFGETLALSADGDVLAVGATREKSGYDGVFPPRRPRLRRRVVQHAASNAGAAYVYRRDAADRWAVEAYVKAPNSRSNDEFSFALALSAAGDALALGAPFERGLALGAHSRDASTFAETLDDSASAARGAAYVYGFDADSGTWGIGAYVKAPNAKDGQRFGCAVALLPEGGLLVNALREGSDAANAEGVFAPTDPGYEAALASDSANSNVADSDCRSSGENVGAAYLYAPPRCRRWRCPSPSRRPPPPPWSSQPTACRWTS